MIGTSQAPEELQNVSVGTSTVLASFGCLTFHIPKTKNLHEWASVSIT
jgi:hypothetical protein